MKDTYKPALLMGLLLFSALLLACSPKASGAPAMGKSSRSYVTSANSKPFISSPDDIITVPQAESEDIEAQEGKTPFASNTATEPLYVRDSSILLGEGEDSLISKLGAPGRIAETEYDFDYYIYNNDYRRLLFVAVKDGLVTGFYTDSTDFTFQGISSGSNLETVNAALGQSFTLSDVLTWQAGQYTVNILMDTIGSGTVTGIYLIPEDSAKDVYTDSVTNNIELLVYDLTNSIRARNDVSILSWSSSAAKSSRKHSKDMAMKNFFSHTGPDHKNPGDRLKAEGVAYNSVGENIIAGYGSAVLSSHGWYTSLSHRETMLGKKYCSIGVGFSYQQDSTYKTYITQDFYR